MRVRAAALLLATALAACGSEPETTSPAPPAPAKHGPTLALAGSLQPGEHAVGFRKERLDLGSGIDLYLWYPATDAPADVPPLTLADYYAAQEEAPPPREELRAWLLDDMTGPPGVEPGTLDAVLDAPMWARRDLEPAPGPHPLALWSYRDSIPTMQAVLNEYLASHGYVVAFAWPVADAPPLPWQGELTAEDKRHSLERQTDLLAATLDSVAARAWVDGERVAVLAWSYGGESAGALQRRRAEIDLALAIDGVLASGWIFASEDDLAALDRSELTAPYALLKNGRPRLGAEPSSEPPLLAEVPAGAWYVRFPELSHGNFNFPGGMLPGVLELEEVSHWAVGGEAARLGYELVCLHARGLLDLHVRGVETAPEQWAAGAPDGFVEVVRYQPD